MQIRIPKGTRRTSEARLAPLRPPAATTPHDWAEAYRILTAEGGTPKPGKWVSEPWQKPVLLAYVELENQSVTFLAASQGGGKTEILLCIMGYHIDVDPCPILVVEPTVDMAQTLSKDRVAPMIAATPRLRDKISSPRSRDSENTILHKRFAGGHLTMIGANSASGLSMRPIRVLLGDERRGWPHSAGKEGSSKKLAEARQTRFWNRRRMYTSSPDWKGSSLHRDWEQTDKCEWFVPCPYCEHEQILRWAQVRFGEKDENGHYQPELARYACEKCDARWTDVERWSASLRGQYRATAPFRGHKGFRFPCFGVTGRKLAEFVSDFLEAQGDPAALQVLTNTQFTEFYEVKGEAPDESELFKRREDYGALIAGGRDLPEGVAVLTMGIDVQADRIEYEITGWGRKEESWLIRYGMLYGDIKKTPEVLDELDEILFEPLIHAKGHPLFIRGASIDTGGHATQAVYRWVKKRLRRTLPNGQAQFVFGIKGKSEHGRPVWPERASRGKKQSPQDTARLSNLWIIGVDAAKEQIYGRLAILEQGPGYSHFPETVGSEYFAGLTAEQKRIVMRKGAAIAVWELPKGRRNEPLDCRVYSYATLEGLKSEPFRLSIEAEARKIEALEWIPAGEPTPKPGAQRTRKARPRMERRGVER